MAEILFFKHDFNKFTPNLLKSIPDLQFSISFGSLNKSYIGDTYYSNDNGYTWKSNIKTKYTVEELCEYLNYEFEKMYKNHALPAIIFSSENGKLKGTKTAVWGKKSHRNDVVKYLENSVRRMF